MRSMCSTTTYDAKEDVRGVSEEHFDVVNLSKIPMRKIRQSPTSR